MFCFGIFLFLLYNRSIPLGPAETLFSPLRITFFSFQYLAASGNTCSSGKQMGCSLMGHSGSGKLNLYTTIFLHCYVKWLRNSVIIILMLVAALNYQSCHCSNTGNVNRVTKYTRTHTPVCCWSAQLWNCCIWSVENESVLANCWIISLLRKDQNYLHFTPRYVLVFHMTMVLHD